MMTVARTARWVAFALALVAGASVARTAPDATEVRQVEQQLARADRELAAGELDLRTMPALAAAVANLRATGVADAQKGPLFAAAKAASDRMRAVCDAARAYDPRAVVGTRVRMSPARAAE
jgi:hypothetical protein